MTGTVAQIWRHPIKSHGREALQNVVLTTGQTLPWDRTWAVAHELSKVDGTNWAPCANFSRCSKAPALQAIRASLDETTGSVTLRHPERPELTINPDTEGDQLVEWATPLMPTERAKSARIVRAPTRGWTDTDYPSISLLSTASNRALSDRMKTDLSLDRWRGNIWLDGLGPWAEREWINKEIQIGGVRLRVVENIVRCMATTANPATGVRDADTLGALDDLFEERQFGVYATVVEGGSIQIGDKAEVYP